jgi:hypothetical protein
MLWAVLAMGRAGPMGQRVLAGLGGWVMGEATRRVWVKPLTHPGRPIANTGYGFIFQLF